VSELDSTATARLVTTLSALTGKGVNVLSTNRRRGCTCSTPCCSSPEGSCLYFSAGPLLRRGQVPLLQRRQQ
jgi:hypothetical protein